MEAKYCSSCGAAKSTSAETSTLSQNAISQIEAAGVQRGSDITATRNLTLSNNWLLTLTGGGFIVMIGIALFLNMNGEGRKVAESFNYSQDIAEVTACTKDSETNTLGRLEYSYWKCTTDAGDKWCVEKVYDPVKAKLNTSSVGTATGKCASLA